MTARIIFQVFNQYQQARSNFVQTIADLSSRINNVNTLESAGVLDLLRPLLSDVVPSIQQTAAIALGHLANHEYRIARELIRNNVISQLLKDIDKKNKCYKKAALFVLRAVVKHCPEIANIVVKSGGLEVMICCLDDFDLGVKEAAAWALGYVARHNETLAQATVDAVAVPLLVLCLQESELCLKQISASALCDIGKHSAKLAQTIVEAGAIPFLSKCIPNSDPKLKRQVFAALGSIAKHSNELAEMIVEADIFPDVLLHMGHPDENVNRTAATLTREVCKHSLELAQLVVNTGGIGALTELINNAKSPSTKLPAIMALGYIAGHSDQLAIAVIGSQVINQLATILQDEMDNEMLATIAWALGQIGKHTSEHAREIALANLLPKLLEMYLNEKSSEDLKIKSKNALKEILQKCIKIEALEPLLYDAPAEILKYILEQMSKILPHDPRSRRIFVTSGGLKKVQEMQIDPESNLAEYIKIINCCFPEEIVRYYSPGYLDNLLESVEQYQPKYPCDNRSATRLSSVPYESNASFVRDNN